MPITLLPKSAKQAAVTSPTYPVPTTVIFILPPKLIIFKKINCHF